MDGFRKILQLLEDIKNKYKKKGDFTMKRKFKKLILIILLILLFYIVLKVNINTNGENNTIISSSRKNQSNEYGNEIYNMTSYNNNFLQYGDWIIFSNGSVPKYTSIVNYKDGIYKYNIKTGQVIKLYDYNGYCLNIEKNNLYFCTEYNLLYKVDLDSLEHNWISDIEASYLLIYNGTIFYRNPNGNNIYERNPSRNSKLIAEYTEGEFQIYDDYIYYIDAQTHNLLKKSIKNTEELPSKIVNEQINNFYVKDNKIIYISKENLKIYNCESQTNEVIKESVCSNFVLKDNNIICALNQSQIIEVDMSTRKETILKDKIKNIYRLQSFDDNIFYYQSIGKSPIISTQLYYLNIESKKQEILNFSTN